MSAFEDKTPIKFQPITQGLGFHPFSDGLPYAPVSKTPQKPSQKVKAAPLEPPLAPPPRRAPLPSGTGAVAAGPATFAYPQKLVAKRVTKTAAPVAIAPVTNPEFPEAALGALYVSKRVLAFLFDSILNSGLLGMGLGLSLMHQGIAPDLLVNPGVLLVAVLFFTLFNWAVITAQEIAFGTSLGKRIFGLSLPGNAGAILIRALFFIPSFGFCGAGLLWCLIDGRRRCWHDLASQVQPQEIARL